MKKTIAGKQKYDGMAPQVLANVLSGNVCRIYKKSVTAEIYYLNDENNILASFNVFDYTENTGTVKINDGYLNVRESPSIDGKIISKLYNGDKVIIKGTSDDGKWIEIFKENIKGYVSKDFIVKD